MGEYQRLVSIVVMTLEKSGKRNIRQSIEDSAFKSHVHYFVALYTTSIDALYEVYIRKFLGYVECECDHRTRSVFFYILQHIFVIFHVEQQLYFIQVCALANTFNSKKKYYRL